ncbi:DUF4383 domain-containing protein [Arthrobacter sp. BB-1]|uniref:DUF4383 domain-containing protein n=1 Tax=unclassified Arthrobacter TaxID=235627 RepID=UPI0010DBFEE3|nr:MULTISPECIES: DUF4383 domain-containing protein [unclassified Arthrobacter]TNB69290.1 DUF4383 domain-containing protein [Arthrobacter sp. BB-1]VII98193.1 hypothetical protein [Arthrobacter sp. DR-2P]
MAASTRLTGPRTRLQKAALGTGSVFVLFGILGFIPGITSNYGSLGFAGPGSGALLLGIFQVSALLNAVHLLFGIAGVLMARTHPQARNFLIYGGVAYLFLWLYGFLSDDTTPANFLPANNADNWLHLALGLAMIGLAIALAARGPAVTAGAAGSDGNDPRSGSSNANSTSSAANSSPNGPRGQ